MAMTVRPGDDDERAIARLAARWGVSKHAAILRAVREADERAEEVDILAVSQEGLVRYAGLLERLGTV
ncbi:MAG: CopG family transcriptional regulator [Actinobacteria bacterium]|nr:CopG family transcriptional regulator [Actinomycetota bacterium]